MTDYTGAKNAYGDWMDARATARKQAREEFNAAIERRIDELTEFDTEILVNEVRKLHEQGVESTAIQGGVFFSNPTLWPRFREAAGIPRKKPGRQAGEPEHGKTGTYSRGCRCDECREAMREYQRNYQARKRGKK